MTDTTIAEWEALGREFYQARSTSQYEWCLIIEPDICEKLRREMILQAPYTVILALLCRQFGTVMGKRIYRHWLERKYCDD